MFHEINAVLIARNMIIMQKQFFSKDKMPCIGQFQLDKR